MMTLNRELMDTFLACVKQLFALLVIAVVFAFDLIMAAHFHGLLG
jgi:hypothetical protein